MAKWIPPDRSEASQKRAADVVGARSVDELSREIKAIISTASSLQDVAVTGELQNFKRHSSGHVYFMLIGESSRVACVMFRSSAAHMLAWPQDGDEVLVTGRVDTYPKTGAYQIYASRMIPVGLGAQMRAKNELKSMLEREGIFDERYKRPIPTWPSKVAVVTSPSGAAVQDILKVSQHRAPHIDIVVVPALVQGSQAPASIVAALRAAGGSAGADCVILARGGGAHDDLSPFDDELVVRAIRSCPLPVVTGIGHETDSSLSDLAADVMAPTPSAAAERVFPDISETSSLLSSSLSLIGSRTLHSMQMESDRTDAALRSMTVGMLRVQAAAETSLTDIETSLFKSFEIKHARSEDALASLAGRLDSLSPLAVLSRGYASCRGHDGCAVRSVENVAVGSQLTIALRDGELQSEVRSVTAVQQERTIHSNS